MKKITKEDIEDALLYAKLCKEHPEGHIMCSPKEKEEFEKWLGVQFSQF